MAEVILKPPVKGATVNPPVLRIRSGWQEPQTNAYLIPEKMTVGMNGQVSTLTLRHASAKARHDAGDEPYEPEWVVADYEPGEQIILEQLVPGKDGADAIYTKRFRGYLGQQSLLIQASPDVEHVSFVAYGPELLLAHTVVHGQWHKTPTQDDLDVAGSAVSGVRAGLFITDLPCVFNHKGQPNCSQSAWTADTLGNGDGGRCFESPDRTVKKSTGAVTIQAQQWTAYQALVSLVGWFDDNDVLNIKDVVRHATALAKPIGEFVAEGLSVLDAMRGILAKVGYGFCLTPHLPPTDGDAKRHYAMHVFPLHASTVSGTRPTLADNAAGNIEMTDAESVSVQRIDFLRDDHNVANEIIVIGDQQRVQQSFIWDNSSGLLKPVWDTAVAAGQLATYANDNGVLGVVVQDTADESAPTTKGVKGMEGNNPTEQQREDWVQKHCTGGQLFLQNKHVFRTFAANDDGWLSHLGHDIADLSDYGVGDSADNYARRPRPLGRTLIREIGTEGFRPAFVLIGIEGEGSTADVLLSSAKPLRDHLGFTIEVNDLSTVIPYKDHYDPNDDLYAYCGYTLATLMYNTLETGSGVQCYFRLVGTVSKDAALKSTQTRDVGSAWPFDSQKLVYRPDAFKQMSAEHTPSGGTTTTRDDLTDIAAYAVNIQDASEDALGHGSIIERTINWAARPGQAIDHTQGRRVDLSIDGGGVDSDGSRYYPIVAQVVHDFSEGGNKTELVLETPLVKVMR